MPAKQFSWTDSLDAGLKGALWIGVIVLLADGIVEQFYRLAGSWSSLSLLAAVVVPLVSFSIVPVFMILKSRKERHAVYIALALIAVSLICRLVWVFFIDAYQVNDFHDYLQFGSEVAARGHPEWSRFGTGVYWRRTAFYTYPIVLLFGQSLLALKLANVILTILAAWFFFQGAKILHGARIAAIALIFFLWNPDLWYSVTLASHDIPGIFWLSVFFLICASLQRQLFGLQPARFIALKLIVLAGGLGLSLFFLDVTRTYQLPAVTALVFYVLVHSCVLIFGKAVDQGGFASILTGLFSAGSTTRQRLKVAAVHALWMLILPFCVYRIADWGFWTAWHVTEQDSGLSAICYYTMIEVLGINEYGETSNWYDSQCPKIKAGERNAVALRKILHDLTHDPKESLLHYERKNRRLSDADDYIDWSTTSDPEVKDGFSQQVRRINDWCIADQRRAAALAHMILLLFVVWRLCLYPRLRFKPCELVILSFSVILYTVMLLFLESQARYDIFLALPFCWMAAQAIEHIYRMKSGSAPSEQSATGITTIQLFHGGIIVWIFIGIFCWGTSKLAADSYLTLRDQTGFTTVPQSALIDGLKQYPMVNPIFIRNNYKQLMLGFAPGTHLEPNSITAAQRTFKLSNRENHHLRFFLSFSDARSGAFEDTAGWDDADFQYYILVNGQVIGQGMLNAIRDDRYFSFHQTRQAKLGSQITLQLILRNLKRVEEVSEKQGPIVALEYIDLQ